MAGHQCCRYTPRGAGLYLFHAIEWNTLDLVLQRKFWPDARRGSLDYARKVSGLSQQTLLHLWAEVRAAALVEILPVGLANVSCWRRTVTLPDVVEAMRNPDDLATVSATNHPRQFSPSKINSRQ